MSRHTQRADVGILGAGIMGCCLALALAQRGYRVDLLDMAAEPMTAASLHNEGKLHLGFVYAKDAARATHRLMLRGSLAFASILEKLTGCHVEALIASAPFHYFVPASSQLDMSAINQHFQEVEASLHAEMHATGNRYLGREVSRYFARNSPAEHKQLFNSALTLGSFRTEEVSVSTLAVAQIIRQAIMHQPRIHFIGGTEVLAAERLNASEVNIVCSDAEGVGNKRYACVANCLWEDKVRVDQSAGIVEAAKWIWRYKTTIRLKVPSAANSLIPSATGILGAYGDVVNHHDGAFYLSWYPLCKLAQSTDGDARSLRRLTPPVDASTLATPTAQRAFVHANIAALAAYIPAMHALTDPEHYQLGGGIILAKGATDIDDPDSYLHQRAAIGPMAYGTYISIDTGKYCTAPLFALSAADMITKLLT